MAPSSLRGDVMWVLLLGSSLGATYIRTLASKVGSMILEASYLVSVSNSIICYVQKSIGVFNLP